MEVPAGRPTFAHAHASPSPARATAPGGRGPCSLFFACLKASSPELGTWQVPRAYLSADLPVKRPMLPSGGCGNRCALKRAQFPEREADQVCAGHKLVGRKQPFSLRVQLSEACHRETDVARPQCLSAPQGAGSPGERGATAGGRPGRAQHWPPARGEEAREDGGRTRRGRERHEGWTGEGRRQRGGHPMAARRPARVSRRTDSSCRDFRSQTSSRM